MMTREQKIDALINRDMDNIFNDFRELESFVAHVLKNGYDGYILYNNQDINDIYVDIFEED
jgi:hypothetical protein